MSHIFPLDIAAITFLTTELNILASTKRLCGFGVGKSVVHSNSYLVTCWLRSAPVCSCRRSKQALPPPAAKWTGDCWQGSGGALTEAPASSRCFRLSTCGKRKAPASLPPCSPNPPGAKNLPTLKRLFSAAPSG